MNNVIDLFSNVFLIGIWWIVYDPNNNNFVAAIFITFNFKEMIIIKSLYIETVITEGSLNHA